MASPRRTQVRRPPRGATIGLLVSPTALGGGSGLAAKVWLDAPSAAALEYAGWVMGAGYAFAAIAFVWQHLPGVVAAWADFRQGDRLARELALHPAAVEAYERLLQARLGCHAIENGAIDSPDIVLIAQGRHGGRRHSPGRTRPVS
ncbi:hypothetical protein [Nonomuraea sp. NPDC048916]|uniref:hypothetical protein n=1 Tax=Nonomuraea sp. NPDC048916 TaxID=3154232 RepID=UPI0033C7DD1B